MNRKITVTDLLEVNRKKRKIAAACCYGYTTAQLVSQITDFRDYYVG